MNRLGVRLFLRITGTVVAGASREDLHFRLSVAGVRLPPFPLEGRGGPVEVGLARGLTLRQLAEESIARVLEESGGDRHRAARILGVHWRALRRRDQRHDRRPAGKPSPSPPDSRPSPGTACRPNCAVPTPRNQAATPLDAASPTPTPDTLSVPGDLPAPAARAAPTRNPR